MKIQILEDIFLDDRNINELDKLFDIILDRHDFIIDDDDTIEVLMESKWYEESRNTTQDIIQDLIVRNLQSSKNKPTLVVSNQNAQNFSIKEARMYLEQKFSIILENSNNDSKFLESLIINFQKDSKKIKIFLDNLWIEFDMAGGSAEDNIKSKINSYTNDCFTKEKHNYLRCFVLADSDKKYPNMTLEKSKENLKNFLEEHNIKYHFLEKREMENYIPDQVYNDLLDNNFLNLSFEQQEYIIAYLKLSPKQKDYFDIEKGFDSKRNFKDIKPSEIIDLFKDLTEEDKNIFKRTSLEQINKLSFKSEFPKLFLSDKVTKEGLLERTKHQSDTNELKNILKKITELL